MNEFQYNGTPQEQAMADLLKTQGHRQIGRAHV